MPGMLSPDLQAAVSALVIGGVGFIFTLVGVKKQDRNYKKTLRFCGVVAAVGLGYLTYRLLF